MGTSGGADVPSSSRRQKAPPYNIASGMAELGLVSDVGIRQAIDHLPNVLHRGEKVRCAASGFLEGRSGLVLATSHRLLFVYRHQTPIDVPYSEIDYFRVKAGILAAELIIEDSVGRAVIKQIHPRRRLVELATLLHDPAGAELLPERRQYAAEEQAPQPLGSASTAPRGGSRVLATR